MADEAETPDNTYEYTDGCASADAAYLAGRAEDMRMACVRAALDLNNGNDPSVGNLIATAHDILAFVTGKDS